MLAKNRNDFRESLSVPGVLWKWGKFHQSSFRLLLWF